MSRTPTMTTQELEALLGPRGALIVTKDNRPNAKKWMTAMGVPADFAATMPYRWLADAYNDLSGASLERAKQHAAKGQGARIPLPEDSQETTPAQETTPLPSPDGMGPQTRADETPAATPALPVDEKTAAAVQALRLLLGDNKGGLDADAVRAIIRKELPNLIPVTRLEIKTPDGVTHDCGTEPRHKTLPTLIQILSCKIPAALVGPAGSGKTTAAEQAAAALNHKFYIQGAVQGAHELLGFVDAHGRYQSTPFRQAFEFGGTVCLDELDAGDPAGVLVCNSALANGCMPFPDRTEPVARHLDFNVVACLNTYGTGADRIYVGRNQLDGATLDRFAFLSWQYDERLERAIVGASDNGRAPRAVPASTMTPDAWCDRVQSLRAGAAKEKARVVISPRATIYGVRLLSAGVPVATIEELCIWKGIDPELRRRIETASAAAA